MANFKNPLDDFRTYSYYHILVACSNTEVAEALRDSSALLESRRNNQNLDEKVTPKVLLSNGTSTTYDPKKTSNANIKGRYVIIHNGSTDTEFNIQTIKWTNVIYPADDTESFTTMAVDGQIVIEEPRGARFMNIIDMAVAALGVDISGVCFMVKTVFVGDGNVALTKIPPLIILLCDLQATFDIVGSTYTISFVGMVNGAGKMKQFNQAPQILTSLKLQPDATLAQALTNFETALNVSYTNYYNNYIKEANLKDLGEFLQLFKIIVYAITFDDVYNDGNKYKEDQFKDQNHTSTNNDPTLSFGDSPTIESALNTIMKHCGGVLEDAKRTPKQGPNDTHNAQDSSAKKTDDRYGYKITSSIVSTEDVITVKYHISRYKLPTTSIIEQAQSGDLDSEVEKNNALLLDYIWTGKNRDILDFEIKMAMGIAFLLYVQTTENLPVDNKSTTDTTGNQTSNPSRSANQLGADNKKYGTVRTVFYPPRSNDKKEVMNVKKASSALEFNELLSRFASLEAMDARLTIRGNPTFLTNLTTLPSKVGDKPKIKNGTLDKKEFANYDRVPSLCKIRIKMPKQDQAFTGNDKGIGAYDDFWYKGYYYIYSIENIFDGSGDFHQLFDIMSLPKELQTLNNDEKTETQKTDGKQAEKGTDAAKDFGTVSVGDVMSQLNKKK